MLVGTPTSSSGGQVGNFIRPSQSGKYLNNEGFLSDNQKIQDSEFYQKFSYVIKAGRNISQWKDTYKAVAIGNTTAQCLPEYIQYVIADTTSSIVLAFAIEIGPKVTFCPKSLS